MQPWRGVFPALATHMGREGQIDLDSTARHLQTLIDAGMHGIVVLGSLGEGNSLTTDEKLEIVRIAVETCARRIPVVAGVSAFSTEEAARLAKLYAQNGADGLMVLPAMAYPAAPVEVVAHMKRVAHAAELPVIIYNNPIAYATDVTVDALAELARDDLFVAIKESSGNTRRITDIFGELGNRFEIFAGVDDLALESVALGASGWIAGLALAFPQENQHLWNLMQNNRWDEARELYRWYSPLCHLDVGPKFVQKIKLAMQEVGLGPEWVRMPRMPLEGPERDEALRVIRKGIGTRPRVAAL